jgi:hypothetical protein
MSLLKYSKKIVKEYEIKYNVKFSNNFNTEFLSTLKSFKTSDDLSIPKKLKHPTRIQTDITIGNKIVMYYSLLNMFNYNFWSPDKNLEYDRSRKLNNIFEKYLIGEKYLKTLNKDIKLDFIKKLKSVLRTANFKMIEYYISDIDKLFLIDTTDIQKDLFKVLDCLYKMKYSYDKQEVHKLHKKGFEIYKKFLNTYFSSYGMDKFYKREILAWNYIIEAFDIREDTIRGIKNFIPIDYRIPSILKHAGIIKLPKHFDIYFNQTDTYHIMYSSEDELALRCFTFITLNKLRKKLNYDITDLQLDKNLFDMYSQYKNTYGDNHFKYFTKSY